MLKKEEKIRKYNQIQQIQFNHFTFSLNLLMIILIQMI